MLSSCVAVRFLVLELRPRLDDFWISECLSSILVASILTDQSNYIEEVLELVQIEEEL